MINFNIRQIQLINKPQKAYNLLKITGLLEFILKNQLFIVFNLNNS